MRVENTELHAPRHRQVLEVREIDLIEGAVIPTGIVAIRHDPLFWILLQRQQTLVSMCDAGNAQTQNDRQDGSPHSTAICRSTHASPPDSHGVLISQSQAILFRDQFCNKVIHETAAPPSVERVANIRTERSLNAGDGSRKLMMGLLDCWPGQSSLLKKSSVKQRHFHGFSATQIFHWVPELIIVPLAGVSNVIDPGACSRRVVVPSGERAH